MFFSRLPKLIAGLAVAGAVLIPAIAGPTQASAQQLNVVRTTSVPYVFAPKVLTVPVGGTVVWTIPANDAFPHTINSEATGPLNSGNLNPGTSFSFTFTQAGTYNYFCRYHSSFGQTGTIVVSDSVAVSQWDQLRQWLGSVFAAPIPVGPR